MLRLKTLGGAVLEGEGGPLGGAAAQRKSVALLGLLAPAGDRGVSRDKLVAYLWPEADAERAAHRLTQLLYALRRDLATEDLFLGASDLRLNPACVEVDAREFREARQAGNLERVAQLYQGPFLDGFFLTGAPEFDHWVENERAGFAREFAEAVETLAAQAGARGDLRGAAWWWQRLAERDPYSSRVTVHLMSALAAAGNRAGALERARSYQELIHRELEAEPNPAILALADRLRQRPGYHQGARGATHGDDLLVAVLPFAKLGAVGSGDHFADGLAEELMSALARLEGVRVISRASVNALRGSDLDAREIGRRLDVMAIMEGSVRQAGDRVRLAIQLVDAADGCHLWSERFERTIADVFEAEDDLSGRILRGVEVPLAQLRARLSSS